MKNENRKPASMMNGGFMKAIRRVLLGRVGKKETEEIFYRAWDELSGIMKAFPDVPKAQKMHTNEIFPVAAIYRVLKDRMPDQALKIVEEGCKNYALSMNRLMRGFLKPRFMRHLYLNLWGVMTPAMFGENAGFHPVITVHTGFEYRMDMMRCPDVDYCERLKTPEITHVFCDSDVYAYTGLPGIVFERKGTLGTGSSRCDFHLYRTK